MNASNLRALGKLLTSSEAAKLAACFDDGDTLTQAMQGIAQPRRAEVRAALELAHITPENGAVAIGVLRALEGAGANQTEVTPVWTLPGHLADYGELTTSIKDLVLSARVSVTCSTFNFQKSSALWKALQTVSQRGTVDVRVYIDAAASASSKFAGSPSASEVAAQLAGAKVFQTRALEGKPVRNHAKFVIVDHRFLIVTSANFSWSAENQNVELGLRIDNPYLARQIEEQTLDNEPALYQAMG
jgi:phosphatidylserine/phosphatidylglycerophosphate/cardiolipin synthase-like enzyme